MPVFQQYQSAIGRTSSTGSTPQRLGQGIDQHIQFEQAPQTLGHRTHRGSDVRHRRTGVVRFTYRKFVAGDPQETERCIEPYLLKEYPEPLVPHRPTRRARDVKTFALDRMADVTLDDARFVGMMGLMPTAISRIPSASPPARGASRNSVGRGPVYCPLSRQPTHPLDAAPPRASAAPPGWTCYAIEVHPTYELNQWFLGFGADIRPLGPRRMGQRPAQHPLESPGFTGLRGRPPLFSDLRKSVTDPLGNVVPSTLPHDPNLSPLSPRSLVSLAYAGTDMPVHIVCQSDTAGPDSLATRLPHLQRLLRERADRGSPSSCWKPSGNAGPWIRQPDSAAGASSRCAASSAADLPDASAPSPCLRPPSNSPPDDPIVLSHRAIPWTASPSRQFFSTAPMDSAPTPGSNSNAPPLAVWHAHLCRAPPTAATLNFCREEFYSMLVQPDGTASSPPENPRVQGRLTASTCGEKSQEEGSQGIWEIPSKIPANWTAFSWYSSIICVN